MNQHHNGGGALAPADTTRICPKCQSEFVPRRKDAHFCSRGCQRNSARGPRTIKTSPTERRRNENHYDRAIRLAEQLYTMPPNQRLGFMKELVDAACTYDKHLRNIFTDPRLLFPDSNERWWFHRRCPAYLTISQAANQYCYKFMGVGIRTVLSADYSEPETGEVV